MFGICAAASLSVIPWTLVAHLLFAASSRCSGSGMVASWLLQKSSAAVSVGLRTRSLPSGQKV